MSNQVVVMPGAPAPQRRARRARRAKPVSKKQQSQKAKSKRGKPKTPRGGSNAGMECAKVYAKALTAPFDASIRGKVCAPIFPARPSQKLIGTYFSPAFTVGSNGTGFVMADFTGANDDNCIYVTDSTFAGTTFAYSGTGITPYAWKTPYGSIVASTGLSAISFRVVAAGFRFRYTGTELNRGGTVIGVVHPTQGELAGQGLNNYNSSQVRRYSVTREWQYMTVTPQSVEDMNFVPDRPNANTILYPWTRSAAGGARPFAALIINSTALNTFEVELIEHLEFVGGAAIQVSTPSHVADPSVVNSLNNAASEATYMPDDAVSPAQQTIQALNGSGVPAGILSAIMEVYGGYAGRLVSGGRHGY